MLIVPTVKGVKRERATFAQGHQLETGPGWQNLMSPHTHSVLRAAGEAGWAGKELIHRLRCFQQQQASDFPTSCLLGGTQLGS